MPLASTQSRFLLEESVIEEAGSGPVLTVDQNTAAGLLVTLGIIEVIEQQSLALTINGSKDNVAWTAPPLVEFPQRFYTGVTSIMVDLTGLDLQFIRAQWKVNRWGRGTKKPRFRMYVFVEPVVVGLRITASG